MDWININDELPEDGEVVLIYTNETNVRGNKGQLLRAHVATFCKGRTKSEVLNTTKCYEFADEFGNNQKPFRWSGDGPCSWFGQEVTHWSRIITPK